MRKFILPLAALAAICLTGCGTQSRPTTTNHAAGKHHAAKLTAASDNPICRSMAADWNTAAHSLATQDYGDMGAKFSTLGRDFTGGSLLQDGKFLGAFAEVLDLYAVHAVSTTQMTQAMHLVNERTPQLHADARTLCPTYSFG